MEHPHHALMGNPPPVAWILIPGECFSKLLRDPFCRALACHHPNHGRCIMTEDETEAEVQLLELVRGNDAEEFKLTIEREAGAWNVTLSTPPHDARHKRCGVGTTFAQAWHGIAALWD
jgi:hypothetical protein